MLYLTVQVIVLTYDQPIYIGLYAQYKWGLPQYVSLTSLNNVEKTCTLYYTGTPHKVTMVKQVLTIYIVAYIGSLRSDQFFEPFV